VYAFNLSSRSVFHAVSFASIARSAAFRLFKTQRRMTIVKVREITFFQLCSQAPAGGLNAVLADFRKNSTTSRTETSRDRNLAVMRNTARSALFGRGLGSRSSSDARR